MRRRPNEYSRKEDAATCCPGVSSILDLYQISTKYQIEQFVLDVLAMDTSLLIDKRPQLRLAGEAESTGQIRPTCPDLAASTLP